MRGAVGRGAGVSVGRCWVGWCVLLEILKEQTELNCLSRARWAAELDDERFGLWSCVVCCHRPASASAGAGADAGEEVPDQPTLQPHRRPPSPWSRSRR